MGQWSGVDPKGRVVTYVFEEDGRAEIYEDGEQVLASNEQLRVEWSLSGEGRRLQLDLVCADGHGAYLPTRYAARLRRDGALVLRSGGPGKRRPADTAEQAEPMQIRLTR